MRWRFAGWAGPPHAWLRVWGLFLHPREQVVLDDVGPEGDIKYWRDANGVHHVPKRPLRELIIG